MWKKDEMPGPMQTAIPETPPMRERAASPRAPGESATIGPSIAIRGEVSGDEDLLIQGHVEGSVQLKQHAVRVGSEGKVKASIVARLVTVEGRVEGDITAEEQIVLRHSAFVQGDLAAPRVVLEDGARFRGGVDMGEPSELKSRAGGGTAGTHAPRAVEAPKAAETPRGPEPVKALGLVEPSAEKGKGATRASN